MAQPDTIDYVVGVLASHVPYVSPEARSIRTDEFRRHFVGTGDEKLIAAVERWAAQVDPAQPPKTLPAASAIWSMMPEAESQARGPNEPGRTYTRPRSHVVAANSAVGELVALFGAGPSPIDSPRRSRKMTPEQRAQLALALASLPTPAAQTRTSVCPGCPDGSGWRTPAADLVMIGPAPAQLTPYEQRVYPCCHCNPTQFFATEWDDYFGRTREEAEAAQRAEQ